MQYQQLQQRRRPTTAAANRVELTGNIFVDNGLAVIAALCKCDKIEDLTLRKMKLFHANGIKLARNNIRLKANHMVFMNSITTQPSYSQKEKIAKYSKITRAILDKIGDETMPEFCDFCGNPYSVDLTELFHKNIKNIKKNKKEKNKKHFVGRDWFPPAGSILNDAQGLPCASRPLNSCGKCLYAAQYLPQGSILVNGLLALFQSTSIPFWYQWVKDLTSEVGKRLALAKRTDKVETLGKEEGNNEVTNRLLAVMQKSRSKKYDPNTSMIMYQYSNGKGADLKKQRIPNFALNFLHAAAIKGLDQDIKELTHLEGKKTSYKYSFLNCIAEQQDYYPLLYPSRSRKLDGASPDLFLLYQTYILKYSSRSLHTAYKIAEYLKSKVDTEKLAINIQRETKKQNTVKKWIIDMARQGVITFDEYYELFIRSPLDRRNPWMLVKYYMLTEKTSEFKSFEEDGICYYNQDYKDRVTKVGTMIFNAYLADRGRTGFVKLLGRFARGNIHRDWLRIQFERLADDNEDFDYSENWNALCINKQGEEDVYQLLYLFRLLWSGLIMT